MPIQQKPPNDPRFAILKPKRNWRADPLDLPLPKFIVCFSLFMFILTLFVCCLFKSFLLLLKCDDHWIGPVPAKEVTFANLNDNIDQRFLEEMCSKFGEIAECRICYNEKTRKHLGLGKVVFQSERSAKECCFAYNQRTKMGNIMTVFLDTMGRERAKMIESFSNFI